MPKRIDGRLLGRRAPPLLACLLVALLVALASGCGDSGDSDSGSSASTVAEAPADTSTTESGGVRRVVPVRPVKQDRFTFARERFVEMCAGCHTLADAGATGRRFNLDHGGGINETHVRSTIATGEPGMPAWKDVLSPREYEELVSYLVVVAKRTPGDDYWQDQLRLRGEGAVWTRADTKRLEAYAHRIVQERTRTE
ncbi:MAG TPA: cytochrome c [Conexibacter sp.]|nr:cytochrome c [Conexibacter sp.]